MLSVERPLKVRQIHFCMIILHLQYVNELISKFEISNGYFRVFFIEHSDFPLEIRLVQMIIFIILSAGSVVIVFNYTGDRLTFGRAVELAKAQGLKVFSWVYVKMCLHIFD